MRGDHSNGACQVPFFHRCMTNVGLKKAPVHTNGEYGELLNLFVRFVLCLSSQRALMVAKNQIKYRKNNTKL